MPLKQYLGEIYSIVCQYYKGRSQINNSSFYLKKLEKGEQMKPKVSIRKEMKIRMEINKIENRKQ